MEQPNACLHATIAPHALAGLGQVSVRAAARARCCCCLLKLDYGRCYDSGRSSAAAATSRLELGHNNSTSSRSSSGLYRRCLLAFALVPPHVILWREIIVVYRDIVYRLRFVGHWASSLTSFSSWRAFRFFCGCHFPLFTCFHLHRYSSRGLGPCIPWL